MMHHIGTAIEQVQTPKQNYQLRPFPFGFGSVTMPTRRERTVKIRHVEPADAGLLVDLFNRLSPTSRRMRFFVSNLPCLRVLSRRRSRAWLELISARRRRCW
jgi:hypothetical protein